MAEDLQLPSQEYLEQMEREKGKEALIWYMWRNVTRGISVLGSEPLESIWSSSTVEHSYSVIRTVLYLAKTGSQNLLINSSFDTSFANTYAAAIENLNLRSFMVKAAIRDVAYISAQDDFKWSATSLYHHKLAEITNWEQSLLANLRSLGLDFLADDLEKVWAGKPLGDHAKNYGKDLPDIVLNEPIALRCAILGFEELTLEPEKPKPIESSPKVISPSIIPEDIKKERRDRLLTQLRDLYKQYDHETRFEERTRTKVLIDQVLKELSEL